jgi:hypothetical protein
MTRKNIWLSIGTAVAALGLAAFMPARALADNSCCTSNWSTNVTQSDKGPQYCNISKGYVSGGVQHNLYLNADIVVEIGIEDWLANAYGNSTNGLSPGVRIIGHCLNGPYFGPTPFRWTGNSNAAATMECGHTAATGVDWAKCQSQVSNGDPASGCTQTCM